MFNESWEGKDLGGFIKTTLAAQIQKSKIGEFINSFGASSLLSTVTKETSEANALKIADGIDMGYQINDKNIIPIIYGHVGMSNTQFDQGQKPSGIDAEVVVQSVKMAISEGPIAGASMVGTDISILINTPNDTPYHLQHVLLNDSFVIDPTTRVANHRDIIYEMTKGDGGTSTKQTATLGNTNPLLNITIEALDDTTNDTFLNDLGDVTAAKGVNNVLYWNASANRWEAKSFNELLNEAGATYDGGAGGDGGEGGSGGEGGTGGEGGVGPSDGSGLKYTQWNPPPTTNPDLEFLASIGNLKTEITITAPPTTGTTVIAGKGAPLRNASDTTPYFASDIDFTDVDKTVDTISATLYFPDGIYKEVKTVETTLDGTVIELCGTQRPDLEGADSGDLDCLTPNVTISNDGQTSTTITRDNGTVYVYLVLTTELCGREFILHETGFPISHEKNGPYEYTHDMAMSSMNAGAGTKEDGSQQFGPLVGEYGDCNSTDITTYDFRHFTLDDYLTTYPDQILNASNTIKVYAWINQGETNSETISTNTYLRGISVCDAMDGFGGLYDTGATAVTPFNQFAPDHGFNHTPGETGVEDYGLANKRCASSVVSGVWSTSKNPDPLLVWDYTTQGEPGDTGDDGADGSAGDTGSAGETGDVTVPTLDPIPFVTGKDASYSGDGVADVVTLPTIDVSNTDPSSTDTLTIAVSQGTLYAVTVPTGVAASGQDTSSLVLVGANPDIQTCLDSGIKFSSTTATVGDVALTLTISNSNGSSLDNRSIRSQAVTEHGAPTFTITVTSYSGTFLCSVKGTAIMAEVTGATSNDTTAGLIASAISTLVTEPDWTATSSGPVVTVTGPAGIGSGMNGVTPTATGTMGTTISTIGGGISPSRKSQPVRNTGNLKAKFLPALAFSNTLTDTDIAFAQLAYRPPQGDGQSNLAEVGFMVGGRVIEYGAGGSFAAWQGAGYNTTDTWGNNPAWVFFDYLTNIVFGLGKDINEKLDADQKERFYEDIYNWAIWCSHQEGGNPIITCNTIIYGAESKIEVLHKIAALGHATFVYLNGNPRLIFDGNSFADGGYTPTVKKLVNQTNASNLTYQSGSIDKLNNVINVKYANRDNFYRIEEVQYRNEASITLLGEREMTLPDLWGCSVKQQALWHGAWVYETEAVNSETVTYVAGWDHFDVLPGDLICLSDGLRVDNSVLGGRVTGVGSGTITLDRSCGSSVKIAVMDTSGVVQYATGQSGTTVTISGTFQENAVWNVYTETLAENYRVIAIEETEGEEGGIYAVTAQKHDPAKYSRVWANTI